MFKKKKDDCCNVEIVEVQEEKCCESSQKDSDYKKECC
jgi:hypothetical protein